MKKYILCSGVGVGNDLLSSFDSALWHSGVANYNLVKVSSILPPNSELQSYIDIPEGSILHTAYATLTTCDEKHDVVATAVAVAIPEDSTQIGVIMEYSTYGNKEQAEEKVISMVKEAMSLREYKIKTIKVTSVDAHYVANKCVSVFSGLAMWENIDI